MKLYFFDCIGYGEQAIVMAESLEDAKKALLASKPLSDSNYGRQYHDKKIDAMVNGRRYTVSEHEAGDVIFTEVS